MLLRTDESPVLTARSIALPHAAWTTSSGISSSRPNNKHRSLTSDDSPVSTARSIAFPHAIWMSPSSNPASMPEKHMSLRTDDSPVSTARSIALPHAAWTTSSGISSSRPNNKHRSLTSDESPVSTARSSARSTAQLQTSTITSSSSFTWLLIVHVDLTFERFSHLVASSAARLQIFLVMSTPAVMSHRFLHKSWSSGKGSCESSSFIILSDILTTCSQAPSTASESFL